jgi:hypothetical protein
MSAAAVAIRTGRVHRRQRDFVNQFIAARATSPHSAVPRSAIRTPGTLGESVFNRLAAASVFVRTGDDRWYVDEPAWSRYYARQKSVGVTTAIVITLAVVALLVVWTLVR